ncbi:uncharacterized protein LOC108887501 isoform X16 [Lates calcarifer]|uniref:Uncharacterized protein LOC108887501 isoform X15 n=2 Tax=Lates calcarifer TaxID=8187 RepID=A0AAJ8B9L8_LATCA|nr:uncharacterized protein LOC108887501 isoform X15 [Lates calcarifer]XP_050927682.1 uncharacterized protein LOC108887501 isoform X16 [Lates calcarifer]
MMAEFTWIQMSLFLILVLQFTAANGQNPSVFTVRVGDDVTLPCENVRDDQDQCDRTTWIFTGLRTTSSVPLFEHGKIHKDAKSKSDRLSVTENCSLVIKKVTVEDVGLYTCRQFDRSGQQQGPDVVVDLSVVTKTEHEDDDKIILTCSVFPYGGCKYTVEWLKDDFTVMETSHHYCSASVNIKTSHLTDQYYKLLQCKVTDIYSNIVQVFIFSLQTSKEKTATTTTATAATMRERTSEGTNKKTSTNVNPTKPQGEDGSGVRTTIKPGTSGGKNYTTSANNNPQPQGWWWWWLIVVAGGLAALIISVVVFVRWKKTRGNQRQTDGNMTDRERGVSYASISYTKKTKSKARVQGDDGEGGAVTNSTVKASSSSAGASIDPYNIYANINYPNK